MKPLKRTPNPKRQAAGRMAKRKGGTGEREWVKFLKSHGCNSARRTVQYNGRAKDSLSDVIADELSQYHQEVKRVESLGLLQAFKVAETQCGDRTPIIAHRKNRKGWYVTSRMSLSFLSQMTWAELHITGPQPIVTVKAEDWIKLFGPGITHEDETRTGS